MIKELSDIINDVNKFYLERYSHLFLETNEIHLYPPNYKKENYYATEIRFTKNENLNGKGNPIYEDECFISKEHSDKFYLFVNDIFKKLSSISDFVNSLDLIFKKIEEYLTEIFVPHEKYSLNGTYFKRLDFNPGVYMYMCSGVGEFSYFEGNSFHNFRQSILDFIYDTITKYEESFSKEPNYIKFAYHINLVSYPLIMKIDNRKVYYARVSFYLKYFLKEIL